MFRTSVMVTGARLGGALVAIATQVLLARLAGAEALGAYYLTLALIALLAMLSGLGLPWITPATVAEAESAGDGHRVATFFSWARRDILLAAMAVSGLAAFIVLTPWIDDGLRLPLLIGAASVPAAALMRMNGAMANARKRFTLAYLPELVIRPVLVFLVAGLFWLADMHIAVWALLIANLVFTLALSSGQTFLLRRDLPDGELTDNRDDARRDYRERRRQALPMVAATLFITIFADLDILIVGLFMKPEELGVFAAALRITMFLAFFIQAAHQIIMRDTADALREENHAALSRLIGRTNSFNLAVSVAALIGTMLFGKMVLGIFGPAFTQGYVALVILVGAQVVRAAAGPGIQLLTIAGHTRSSVPVFAVSTAALLAGNAVLIPAFGMAGAAVAVLGVTMLWTVWIGALANARTGVANLLHLR